MINIEIREFSEGEEIEKRAKKIFEEVMSKKFQNLLKAINVNIEEVKKKV